MGAKETSRQSSEKIGTYFEYCNPNHVKQCFDGFNLMRKLNQLCDVALIVGEQIIRAHKVVLASTTPYFYAMFNDDMTEKYQKEVILRDMDTRAVSSLIEYLYTGSIQVTEDNVQVLLPASSLLQVNLVREACCEFLQKQLHPTNCLGIRTFAEMHSCGNLLRMSDSFILKHFQQVTRSEEFNELSFKHVESIIKNERLNVHSEEHVFTAVIDWVKYDVKERNQYVDKLLRHIRLPLMKRGFLTQNVEPEPLIKKSADCKEYLLEAMKYHLLPEERSMLAGLRTMERKPDGFQPYIFVIGGGSLFAIHAESECYSPHENKWINIRPMTFRRSRAGVASLGRHLYAVGGYDGTSDLANGEIYYPHTNKWAPITPMGTRRSCLGIGGFNGLLYACGGYDGASCLSSVERYDALTGVWSSCPAMSIKRRYCRVDVIDGSIYAVGGFDSTNYQASVEQYDPRVGVWKLLPNMNSRRSSCGVATIDGFLYCVGGNDGTNCMSSGERFNHRRMAWEPIVPMNIRRSTHDVVVINGHLVVLGGNDGTSSLNSVESYDPKLNKWTILAPMGIRRSSLGAAVVNCADMEMLMNQTEV